MNVIFDKNREYEWLIISQSYFQSALVTARILSKKLQTVKFGITEGSPLDYCMSEIFGDYAQGPDFLFFPVLYNFKHGIEIYLKAIFGMQNREFSKGHNLLDLYEKSEIVDAQLKEIITKYVYAHLLVPGNDKPDNNNEFERYPQGSPYDELDTGMRSLIDGVSLNEKIKELIDDIEFVYRAIRKESLKVIKQLS